MKLPASLRIRSHDYEIIIAPDNPLRSDDIQGLCDSLKNTITIPSEAPPSRQIETLFHEALHAALAGHSIDQEEMVVTILGEFLPVFLRDNRQLIRNILRAL